MKTIEALLEPITGYLISITRNAIEGWYEMELGIPKGWVFNENKEIKCEVISEVEGGKIIKISPKNTDIVIDDLVTFVVVIMDTNKKIADKEREFTERMTAMKKNLEKEVQEYYEELDKLKENSFKNLNDNFERSLHPEGEKEKRHRRTKAEMEVEKTTHMPSTSGLTETTVEPYEKIHKNLVDNFSS